MTRLKIVCLIIIFASCNNQGKKNDSFSTKQSTNLSSNDSVDTTHKNIQSLPQTNRGLATNSENYEIVDSTNKTIKIHFDFDDFSEEGGEGYAVYNKLTRKISKASIILFGERNRFEIEYNFSGTKIKVTEKDYDYLKSIDEIKSDSDMKLDSTIQYYTDNIKDESSKEIFNKFKTIVPFNLK